LKHTKPLADTLTIARAILGLCIAGLGLSQGRSVLPTVVTAVIIAWLSDLLDGGLVLAILLFWCLHSHQLAWPFYALPYVILLWAAFQEAPAFGWLAVAYLGMTLVLRWRRLMNEFLPQFFGAVGSLRGVRNDHVSDASVERGV